MAIKTGDNFLYRGKKPLDDRDSFDTISDMIAYDINSLDEGHISYCKAKDKYYKFNSSNEDDPTTGKWREYNAGGSTIDIVDDLNTQSAIAPLSANQGYILSQMFLSDLKFNSITREVELISKNGTKTTYSLKTFIDDVHKTLMQPKAIYCDKLPTCAQDSDGNYIVTYVKGGTTLTTNAANTWFYYKDNNREDVQTIFVDGEEITIQSGTIGDVVAIDPVSKNWLINGVDTGESSKGDAGKDGKSIRSITKDDDNNIIVTFTDGSTQNIGKLSVDIQGDFLTSDGFGNLRYYNGHFQYYDTATSTWIDTSVTPSNVYIMNMTPQEMKKIFAVYDTNLGKYKLKFEEPDDTVIDGQVACIVEKVIIRRKLGSVPTSETDGELVLEIKRKDFGSYKNEYFVDTALSPSDGDIYYYKAFPMSTTGFYNTNPANETDGIKCKNYNLYGFKLDQNESDPANMITYLSDCDNKYYESAKMNYDTDTFDYGDWDDAWFIKNLKPCMLKYDGTVDYELDKNDYTKKLDGSSSDIINDSYDGNAMVGVPKVYWKVTNINNHITEVRFSDKKVDSDYVCWSHLDNNGNEIPYCYMPCYTGAIVNNKLRSLSGKAPIHSYSGTSEITYAIANNQTDDTIWYIETFSDRILINMLLLLIGKSTDTQTIFGNGHYTGGSGAGSNIASGTMNTKGLFYGTNGTWTGVKVFGMEHYWGNQFRRIAGWFNSYGTQKIKLTYGQSDGSTVDGYNTDGTGYIEIPNSTPSGSDGGYISKLSFGNYGYIPVISNGSATTYCCDGLWFANEQINCALVGGSSYYGYRAGAFCLGLDEAVSSENWGMVAAISCKPLATT